METVWVESIAEPNIPLKNEFKFDVKSEPENDTKIENELKPYSATDKVLEAEVQVKSELDAVIWIKSEPGDVIKKEPEVDVCINSEPEADDWMEIELETVLEFPGIKIEDSKVSVFRLLLVCS